MTAILEKAWKSVLNLPEDRQEFIAHLIIEEIQDEKLWEKKFIKSQKKLSLIADKVRNDIRTGRIQKKGFGEL
jgi:hypothetical protein